MPDKARSRRSRKHFRKSSPEPRDGEYSPSALSNAQAAKLAGVSVSTIKAAKTVLAHGTADEIRAVREGKAFVGSTAAKIKGRADGTARMHGTAEEHLKEMSEDRSGATQGGAPAVAKEAMRPFHPLADIFPFLEGKDFDELVASIKASGGPRENIVLYEGMILDGRNRARACEVLGLKPKYSVLPEWIDPLIFVLDRNLHRRHLDDRQRASVAGKIANLSRGGDRSKPPIGGLSVEKSAEVLNVAPRQVERARVVHQHGGPEVRQALDRGEISVSIAEEIARLPAQEQPAAIAKALPNGARAIMGSRQEPGGSLDFFPTPPWAVRALVERVLPRVGIQLQSSSFVWEPAAGEGHIAEVLREYCGAVLATDIHDYGGYNTEMSFVLDFFEASSRLSRKFPGLIVTNPPFGDKAIQFVKTALDLAPDVAMFFRSQWAVEGIERYEQIFRDRPPTLCAFFVERVPLCKGRWDPDGTTATAYCWLVWAKERSPQPPFWIPPDCRETLTRADDRERFTAHPVIKKQHIIETVATNLRPIADRDAEPAQPPAHAGLPSFGEEPANQPADDLLEIPAFLRRDPLTPKEQDKLRREYRNIRPAAISPAERKVNRDKFGRLLPQSMDAGSWAILSEIENAETAKRKEDEAAKNERFQILAAKRAERAAIKRAVRAHDRG